MMFKASTIEAVTKMINDELELQNKRGKTVTVQSSQMLQIGEANPRKVSMFGNGQPHVDIYFIIILFFTLADTKETFAH